MLEYEAVLTRPANLIEARVTREQVEDILDALGLVLTPVRIPFSWGPQLKDPTMPKTCYRIGTLLRSSNVEV